MEGKAETFQPTHDCCDVETGHPEVQHFVPELPLPPG
jgi:hypothetical protein